MSDQQVAPVAAQDAVRDVGTVVHEGIEVQLDRGYARSWEGLRTAARMQSSQLSVNDRFLATIDYYSHMCPNIDDVVEALREARPGEEVTGNDVMAFVAQAVREGTPKN